MLALALALVLTPTFAKDVAPIIYHECAACHRPGQQAPFSLLSYEDVRKHGPTIAAVTARRYMPPWLPAAGYGDFEGERRLSDTQIKTIADWVRAGMPEGERSDEPPAPHFQSGWQLGEPDLILKAPHAFTTPASGRDVFWNFVFTPDLAGSKYVRAIEVRPGITRGLHHANLLVDRAGTMRARTGGFPGMDVSVGRNAFDPDSHFLFWKPGSVPESEPDGLAWRLDPGNLLILNTHVMPTGRREQLQPEIGMYFTDKPPTRFPLLMELENDPALDIPAGDGDFLVSDDFKLPIDVNVLAVYPHAHYLGKRLEAYATLPDGSRRWLIKIPDWNLDWQAVFRYREPVFLPAGSTVSMRYHYDNSAANPRNPNSPPKRVVAGNNSTDEMAHFWMQVLPRGHGDKRRELQEAMARHKLAKDPNDPTEHMNLGIILLSLLDTQGAEAELRRTVELAPDSAQARDLLGTALRRTGRLQEAVVEFRRAVQCDSGYVNAHYDLALALAASGQKREAVQEFGKVAAAYPKVEAIQKQYASLQQQIGTK